MCRGEFSHLAMNTTTVIRKFIFPVIAAVVLAALVASLVHFRGYSPYHVRRDLIGNPEVVMSLRDVEIAGREDGKPAWSFDARRADVSRGRVRTILTDVRAGKLYDRGKPVATVAAGKAVYNSINGNVEVTDGVKIKSVDGYQAEAQKVVWTGFNKHLYCPGKVVFRSKGGSLAGNNLIADVRNGEVTLDNGKLAVEVSVLEKLGEDTPGNSGKVQ